MPSSFDQGEDKDDDGGGGGEGSISACDFLAAEDIGIGEGVYCVVSFSLSALLDRVRGQLALQPELLPCGGCDIDVGAQAAECDEAG